MGIEREVKLGAGEGFALPDLNGLDQGVAAAPLPDRTLDAVYYDTSDLRLARWGVTLRHRVGDVEGDGWTVKLPEDSAGPALSRREITFDSDPAQPPPAAVDLVRAFARRAEIGPVARMRTIRSVVELRDVRGRPTAEVVDDDVSVLDGSQPTARFREIEVELTERVSAALLEAVLGRLGKAGAGEPQKTPKLMRVLGDRALGPPDVALADVDDHATMGDVVRLALASSVRRILLHDPGMRLGDDSEHVHQARVGTRRLRSDLRTLRPVLVDDWVDPLREELRWLGHALGMVRDADVLSDRLRDQARSLPEVDAPAVELLLGQLADQRAEAVAGLRAVMAGDRYVELLDRLVTAAQHPHLRPEADERAADVLPRLAAGSWRRLRKAIDELVPEPSAQDLHAVRIAAKRTRYAAEAAAPVIAKRAKALAGAVADLQTVLGDHQDAVVAEAWLRGAVVDAGTAEPLAAGQLIAMQRADQARCRAEWPGVWKRAKKKKLRSWLA
ncbi:MAG: CHAD domain-containing protein [Acidimicrobiales bacterium]